MFIPILATLCYIQQRGRTLMLYRNKKPNDVHQGKWNGLGGKMEAGETPEECVVREVKEESGLSLHKPRLRGIITFPGFTPEHDWTVFVFLAHKFSGILIDSDEGELQWIENRQLLKLNLWEGDRLFLRWLKGKKFFSGKIVYKEKKLVSYSATFYP